MSLAGIMGNLQHDSELMSERHKAQGGGRVGGWLDGSANKGESVKKKSGGRLNGVQTDSEGERLADEWGREGREK